MSKKVLSIILSLVMVVVLAVGCGGRSGTGTDTDSNQSTTNEKNVENSTDSTVNGDSSGPKYGGTLRYASHGTTSTPGYTPENTNNSSLIFLTTAYESLLTYDEHGKLIPKLATEWTTDANEPSITWTLRQGVQFADGTDFNAEAVKRNIEEYQKCERNETANIASCEVTDDYTIKMVLKEWNSSTLEGVGFFVYYMSPKALEDVASLRESSCGTGPFQVSEFNSGVSVKYTKNENYWQEGKPYLDAVEIYIVDEPSTRASAFQAGEYDIVLMNNLTIAQSLINNPEYVMEVNSSGAGLVGTGLIPNSADPDSPFADARVRQAMCYAIDTDALVKAFGYGFLKTTNQWAAPGAVTYSDEVKGYPYNPDKAKELLTEAGYPDGFDTVLNTDAGNKNIFTAAANMLAEVGIRAKLNLVDETAQVNMYSGKWEGIMGHFHSISPDLGLYMGRHLDVGAPFYASGIQHPEEAMKLLEEIRVAPTEEVKIEKEHEMQKLIYDKLALFGQPIFIQVQPVFKHSYVMDDNRSVNHVSTWTIENTWLDK